MATITKRGKSYLLRVYAGYDSRGKQIEKSKTWLPPIEMTEKQAEKEAHHQAALFEESIRNGDTANGKVKFSIFSEMWFTQYAEKQLRPRTVAGYRDILKQINAAIGHLPLEKIKPTHLLDFYSSLEDAEPRNSSYQCIVDLKSHFKSNGITKAAFSRQQGISLTTLDTAFHRKPISRACAEKICVGLGVDLQSAFVPTTPGRTLSPATVRHYHHLISDILGAAVKWQYIPYNPCERVSPPKSEAPDIAYLDDEQAQHLVELLREEPGHYRRAVLLLLLTGMRRGELMGLEWKDIDWKSKTIIISRSSQYLPKKGVFTDTTKNKTSKRIVYISEQVLDVLREQLLWQQCQANSLGNAWGGSPRIVTTPAGFAMRPDRLTHWFARFIKKSDLPPIHIHSLRHTYATLCIAKGVPITAVAAQLGHANVATTTAIYAHAIKSAQLAAADKVGGLFANIL